MKTLKFEGYSDDTFGEYGVTHNDCDNCASLEPIQCLVKSGDESLVVVGQYAKTALDACWVIGVTMEAENKDIPEWDMRVKTAKNKYSPILEIDVPDDFSLQWFNNGEAVETAE